MKFKKQTASGVLVYEKNKQIKFQPCASIIKLKFKTVGRKTINTESKAITIVPGLNVLPLDEDYDIEGLEYLLAQKIYHVAIVDGCLKFKYTNGREKKFGPGQF